MKNALGVGLVLVGAVLVLSAVRNEHPGHVVAQALGLRDQPPDKLS